MTVELPFAARGCRVLEDDTGETVVFYDERAIERGREAWIQTREGDLVEVRA